MTVSFVAAGARIDSAGAHVTTIDVPYPASTVVGDYLILFGRGETYDDWLLAPDWDRIGVLGQFQIWGRKRTGSGAGSVTVPFPESSIVRGMVIVGYRGVSSLVETEYAGSLTAPSARPPSVGRCVRLYGATTFVGTASLTVSGATTRVPGTAAGYPMLIADEACTTAPTGSRTATRSGSPTAFTMAATVALGVNRPPNAPTLDTPADAASLDRTVAQRFAWTASDPDVGASQSRFDLRYSSDGGTVWTTVTGTTPSGYADIAGGTFALGSHQWQVRTYDQFGLVGPYSPSRFFTAVDHPDTPTITYPTSGGTVSQADRVDWSEPDQEGYQVRRVADDAGDPDPGTVYFDSGQVVDPDTRSLGLEFDTNDRFEHIQVSARIGGVWSDFADVRVLVSYTPPPVPDLQVTIGDDGFTHVCTWTNGDPPDETQPATTSIDLAVSADGGATVLGDWPDSTGLPITGELAYPWPASGVEHCYRATAHADNGTTSATDWISLFRLTVDEVV